MTKWHFINVDAHISHLSGFIWSFCEENPSRGVVLDFSVVFGGGSRGTKMSFVTSQGDIADTYQKAASTITALAANYERSDGGESQQPLQYRYADELRRLEIWNGEHNVDEGKLDHKLREASLFRDRILELLSSLVDMAGMNLQPIALVSD